MVRGHFDIINDGEFAKAPRPAEGLSLDGVGLRVAWQTVLKWFGVGVVFTLDCHVPWTPLLNAAACSSWGFEVEYCRRHANGVTFLGPSILHLTYYFLSSTEDRCGHRYVDGGATCLGLRHSNLFLSLFGQSLCCYRHAYGGAICCGPLIL